MQDIHVAHSPDSDDAFMFWALAHDKVDTEGLNFIHHLDDIQTLNEYAMQGKYEVTAISYYAYSFLKDKYAITSCGSSIGDKYGPVLVSNGPLTKEDIGDKPIAVPGKMTSAYLALKLWYPEAKTEIVPFNEIGDKVKDGTFVAGVIIHEGQLTYVDEGFYKVVDLGEWWYELCSLPLPLGCNAVRRDLGEEIMVKVARVLKRSIEAALENRQEALEYAAQFARGLDFDKMDKFVEMYVNRMTVEADMEIQKAARLMLFMGYGQGLVPEKIEIDFINPDPKVFASIHSPA